MRDQIAALTIKDEQRQDEIDQLNGDIQELETQLSAMNGELNEARERYEMVDQVSLNTRNLAIRTQYYPRMEDVCYSRRRIKKRSSTSGRA